MNFLYPNTLWFLLLLSIPILIHLFHFRKHKKIYFSSLRFMKSFQKEKKAVKKLQNLIILICRLIALGFLVLAFSQPFYNANDQSNPSFESIVSIYIDNSFSMTAKGSAGELLSEAKEAAKRLVSKYPQNQRYIISSNDLSAIQQRVISSKDALYEIDGITYSPIQRKFNTIWNWQQETNKKESVNHPGRFENLFLSDFQRDYFSLKNIKADSNASLNLWQFKPQKSENCFIDSLWFNSKTHRLGEGNELFFEITNDSDEDLQNLEVNVRANDFSKDLFVNIPKKSSLTTSVTIPSISKQTVQGKIELRDQMMYWDDNFYFSYQATGKSDILIINGDDSHENVSKAFTTEAFFNVQEVDMTRVNPSVFFQKKLLVLNGIKNISSGLQSDITNFQAKGGSVFILPSPQVVLSQINPLLKQLQLPEITGKRNTDQKAINLEFKDPIFSGVFEKEDNAINLPTFKRVFQTNFKNSSAIPLMSLRDQTPIFFKSLENSYALYSCLNEDCSDFIQNTLFPVLCIRIAEMAGGNKKPYHFIGQDELIAIQTTSASEGPIRLKNEGKDFIPKLIQDGSYKYIDLSGIEAMENLEQGNFILEKDDTLDLVSLNYDRTESSVDLMTLEEMTKKLEPLGFRNLNSQVFNNNTDVSKIKLNLTEEYWRICIFITIMAMFCEILIAKIWKN